MNIPFTKMQGLGNDFVVIEEDQLPADVPYEEMAARMCDRHLGIGADGLVIVAPPDDPSRDIRFKFYNADGSVAEMCGNGIRCFARYVRDQGLIKRNEFKVETLAGVVVPKINADTTVTVDMGKPMLNPENIPFTGQTEDPVLDFSLEVTPDLTLPISAVGMGNPHCILFTDSIKTELEPTVWGPQIETHRLFPAKTNVEFVKVKDRKNLIVNVWERGVGITLACGSGACAVAVAAILKNLTEEVVDVHLPGGTLRIEWRPKESVMMTGPASYVYVGTFPYVTQNVSSLV